MWVYRGEVAISAYLPYAGIGTRNAGPMSIDLMRSVGLDLATRGLTLRSGSAIGSDAAFEEGCDDGNGSKEIFIPWDGYQAYPGAEQRFEKPGNGVYAGVSDEVLEIASQYHPYWHSCKQGARKLLARNTYQVLGKGKPYSAFVVCLCPLDGNGEPTGGTSQAIRIALAHNIPVFNLEIQGDLEDMYDYVDSGDAMKFMENAMVGPL